MAPGRGLPYPRVVLRLLVALALIGGLGFLGYQKLFPADGPKVAPVQVGVKVPNPLGGGEAPESDRIYVP